MGNKSTEAEIDLRVSEVQDLLLNGETRHKIVRFGSKWGISARQIDDYIAAARERIKEINATSLQENMALVTTNLWRIFRASVIEGDLAEANKALMNLAKVKGLENYTVTHVIEDKRELADLPDAELDRLLLEDTH